MFTSNYTVTCAPTLYACPPIPPVAGTTDIWTPLAHGRTPVAGT